MSGHSKWATTKRKKAKIDQARAKVWTRITREITISVRLGGKDPDANSRLRLAIVKAKSVNMPARNIETAILKGAGELEGVNYEEAVYEGYGPSGVAFLLECLTDNRNRTVGELRSILTKHGGAMAESGAVGWMFKVLGRVGVKVENLDEDQATELAIEVGGQDVRPSEDHEGAWEILTAPDDLAEVTKAVEARGLPVVESGFVRIAENLLRISDEDAEKVGKLIDILDDHDDVQALYTNVEFSDEDANAL